MTKTETGEMKGGDSRAKRINKKGNLGGKGARQIKEKMTSGVRYPATQQTMEKEVK